MLLTVKIPIASVEDDLRLIRQELASQGPGPYIPVLFLRYIVETIRPLRADDSLGLSPRAGFDAALICRQIALQIRKPVAGLSDVRQAVREVVRTCEQPDQALEKAERAFPEIRPYLCRYMAGIELEKIGRLLETTLSSRRCTGSWIRTCIISGKEPPGLDKMASWVAQQETMRYYEIHEVMAAYLEAFLEGERDRAQEQCDGT